MKEIKLIPQNYRKPILFAKVDDSDYELLNKYDWSYGTSNGITYPYARINKKTIRMHKLILDDPEKTVDHINHNTLDNRRENLRYATQGQQIVNRRKNKNGITSKYKGVSKSKYGFIAQITFNYICIHLGTFQIEENAAHAYDRKARELFGDYAKLNFPEEN